MVRYRQLFLALYNFLKIFRLRIVEYVKNGGSKSKVVKFEIARQAIAFLGCLLF